MHTQATLSQRELQWINTCVNITEQLESIRHFVAAYLLITCTVEILCVHICGQRGCLQTANLHHPLTATSKQNILSYTGQKF